MDQVFLALLAAHLVAEVSPLPRWSHPGRLVLRLAIALVLTVTFLGAAPWPLLLVLTATNLALDARGRPERLPRFALQQSLRLALFAGLAFAFPGVWRTGHRASLSAEVQTAGLVALTLLAGLLINLAVGAEVIRRATAAFVGFGVLLVVEGLRG